MAICLDENNMYGSPFDYGCSDWHHNQDGKVDYPYYKHGSSHYMFSTCVPIEEQSYHEDYAEEALDNLDYGRNKYIAICEGFDEWERNERIFN